MYYYMLLLCITTHKVLHVHVHSVSKIKFTIRKYDIWKTSAPKYTLSDVRRWSNSRDTDHFLKESQNELVQFNTFLARSKNDLYLGF